MIITQQVKDAVHQKLGKTFFHAYASNFSFSRGSFNGNNHVAEKLRSDVIKLACSHGKCDDIGRAVSIEIFLIKLSYFGIINDKYGKLCIRTVQGV